MHFSLPPSARRVYQPAALPEREPRRRAERLPFRGLCGTGGRADGVHLGEPSRRDATPVTTERCADPSPEPIAVTRYDHGLGSTIKSSGMSSCPERGLGRVYQGQWASVRNGARTPSRKSCCSSYISASNLRWCCSPTVQKTKPARALVGVADEDAPPGGAAGPTDSLSFWD